MRTYNKIMQNFWLLVSLAIVVAVTYKGFAEGFERWAVYYIFAVMTIGLFFLRRYMMKRMERHQDFLKEKEKEDKKH
ncbi:MAG: hypothetical protein ACQERC_04990 [Bacteroidota bacterium]